jgi:thiol-disulfide isomerase/thioredoxin
VVAAERVLADSTVDKHTLLAATAKFETLHKDASLGDDAAQKRLDEFVDAMRDDARERIAQQVRFFLLERQVIGADVLELAEVPALLAEVKAYMTGQKLDQRHLRMASHVVRAVNRLESLEEREKYFAEFGKLFAASSDHQLARYGKSIMEKPEDEPAGRVGKPLPMKGVTTEGTAFDLASYQGRVVLVEFWATNCVPCRAQLPDLKALYEKYKPQRFEVVGVSLDEDAGAVAAYLKEHAVAWTNLAGSQTKEIARAAGVIGTPTLVLIGADGKVAAAAHRLEPIAAHVARLLDK